MAEEKFFFAPKGQVPETIQRESQNVMTMGGWTFSARPTTPIQRKFRVKLHGMRWYLNDTTGLYDTTAEPTLNAKLLEEFYERHETYKPFLWVHPHRGEMLVRFAAPVNVPAGKENGYGLIDAFEINLMHHNPSFADDFSAPPTVLGVPQNTIAAVSVTGTVAVGSTLTGTAGQWTNNPTEYLYSWERDGSEISGANTVNYTLQFIDRGKEIKFVVRAKNAAGTSNPSKSPPVVVPAVTLDNTRANSTVLFANDDVFRGLFLDMQQQINALEG